MNFVSEALIEDVVTINPSLRQKNRRKMLNPTEYPVVQSHVVSASKNNETPAFQTGNNDSSARMGRSPSAEAVFYN